VIGAVSPPGGDLPDPVVQATLRVVKVFWSLEDRLAYQRHFPAISWLNSYSLYIDDVGEDVNKKIAKDFTDLSKEAMRLLEEEAELQEIVRLIGVDALSPEDRLILEGARSIREDFLHQNAFHEIDTYASLEKQYKMLSVCLFYYTQAKEALARGVAFDVISKMAIRDKIARMRYLPESDVGKIDKIKEEVEHTFERLIKGEKEEEKKETTKREQREGGKQDEAEVKKGAYEETKKAKGESRRKK